MNNKDQGETIIQPRLSPREEMFDVVLAEDVVLQPDILFISKERGDIIKTQAVMGPPDLVVEIASPSTSFYDTVKKRGFYQRFGVREFWLVFPEERAIEVMTLEEGIHREFSFRDFYTFLIGGNNC